MRKIDYNEIHRNLILNESIDITPMQCLRKIKENLESIRTTSVSDAHTIKQCLHLIDELKRQFREMQELVRQEMKERHL